ncbi:DNA-processing protein DprA [Bifidobacterium tsurumiense]|uniref:DNA-processing protein DprA n=1 Tax=Bifidobacterium tsurumiense TaxID=356829 RepID=UPI0012B3B37B|nr:DNA-processing protein DprA [Bifidobacterium tsurumiense]MSS12089.1 DNA-processing protein DprA [Bifidobacterium tsurumiense]
MSNHDVYGMEAVGIPDDETLARAALTYCLDGADAIMHATLLGAGSAISVLQHIRDIPHAWSSKDSDLQSAPDSVKQLEQAFYAGLATWGKRVTKQASQAFMRSLRSWHRRSLTAVRLQDNTFLNWISAEGAQWIIGPHSALWPTSLQDLSLRGDWAPPLCLWGRGDPIALNACSSPLAIVGSRGVNTYGHTSARALAFEASKNGHTVISGGALGSDAAAHWGTIAAQEDYGSQAGATIAVFAGGLNHIGPKSNLRLFDAIVEHGGALLSEMCPGTIPQARRFLLRNRIIASLASTIVVSQARLRSGAINTAGWANELNRKVYAIPGNIDMPHNAGCNRLVHDGKAILLDRIENINDALDDEHTESNSTPPIDIVVHNHRVQPTGNIETIAVTPPSEHASHQDASTSSIEQHHKNHAKRAMADRDDSESDDSVPEGKDHNHLPDNSHAQDLKALILQAIRLCNNQHIPASIDAVLMMLCSMSNTKSPAETPPHDTIVSATRYAIASMELEGTLLLNNGQLHRVHTPNREVTR